MEFPVFQSDCTRDLFFFFAVLIFTRVVHTYFSESNISTRVPRLAVPYPFIPSSELSLSVLWADSFGVCLRISK